MINQEGHLSTGIDGTNALAQVLGKFGRADVMYTIATQTTFPSWGYEISKGATTIWESWADKEDLSLNMKMFGSSEKFFYKDLAGISPASPGYKRIVIKPRVVGDLTYANASIKTVRGKVSSSWKKTDDSLTLEVTIPVNSTAEIGVPKISLENVTVTESGQPVFKAGKFVKDGGIPGITGGAESADYVTFDAGSGSYRFKLTGTPERSQ
jgi:alpha-L-rhamnosidase